MRLLSALFLNLIFLLDIAFSQAIEKKDPFLEQLSGQWVMRGTIDNQETTHDISVNWILNNLYLRIDEISREKDKGGRPLYEAMVLLGWDGKSGDYQCLWLDITGGGGLNTKSIGHGKRVGDSIPFLFRDTSDQFNFRNTFVYEKESDSWRWDMDGMQDGKAIPFARVRLTRK